jgi:hypothetical protein
MRDHLRVTMWTVFSEKYVERGPRYQGNEDSPVHRGPVNQTWGIRELYVTDAEGNTLYFAEPLPQESATPVRWGM